MFIILSRVSYSNQLNIDQSASLRQSKGR